jgi:hypothetical protein
LQVDQLAAAPGPNASELAALLSEARAELDAERAAGVLQEARLAQLASQMVRRMGLGTARAACLKPAAIVAQIQGSCLSRGNYTFKPAFAHAER